MYRYRRYRRSFKPTLRKVKYSNETMTCSFAFDNPSNSLSVQKGIALIPELPGQGMRKVKNFSISISGTSAYVQFAYALVYVPQGTQPTALGLGSTENAASLYEPNQNVIMSGLINNGIGNGVVRNYSRLARNLNSGDQICIILRPLNGHDQASQSLFVVSLNYAICYS